MFFSECFLFFSCFFKNPSKHSILVSLLNMVALEEVVVVVLMLDGSSS